MPSYTRRVEVPGKNSQELYDKVSTDIERFLSKAPIGKMDIERDAANKQVHVKSSMVTATLACGEGFLKLDAKLSLLAAPFRGKLDEGIDAWVKKTFNLA